QLKEDLGDLSIGNYIIRPNYRSGKIEPSTGEEVTPYDTARISEKLNFDNYESVNVRTTESEDPNKGAYISVFEFDSLGKYIKQIANTVHEYTITPTNHHLYVLQWWFGGTDFENRLPYTKVSAKSLLNKKDKEKIYADLSPKTEVKLDLPDKLFIVKGETIELFKYGMYYTDTEFINNQYNVRVVNIDEYTTQYDDKIVISCPKDYSKPILQGTNDLALFQLINTYGKVIEQKRVKIFVADKATISDIDRNIMYLGDSFTGMGFRTQEIANLIAKESNLTKTKLIGKFIGQGSGNRFTGTGGYSWENYTENPNTLPSAYPNNYLWDADNNHISMKYLVDSLGETHLEYVVILLGWNDYESGAFASSFSWDVMKQRAKRLIENIHNYYPTCKIILESYHYMYPLHRKSYGNALPQVKQNKYIYDLNRFYQEIANEYEYVEFVQMSIQIDVLHNMGFEEERVNKRSKEIVKYCKDVVHPSDIGFYQYSDAEFNALLYLMQ
ncbi:MULTISPECIES: SGNH/GDSL hydrolase family protein, partial [unclassified Holdemanella]|uniref:SGNH/GDSL hydrolase family protein n=1 Tax=unclassified Holdemanella TaxID=2633909 RepID=UPI001D0A24DA